jgi:hypothetical protein
MPPSQQLITLMILATSFAWLGIVFLSLGTKQGRAQHGPRLTKSPTSSTTWRDVAPVFDSGWPELCFDMDVRTTRFNGALTLFVALFIGLMMTVLVNQERVHTVWSILCFAAPLLWLVLGGVMSLSSLPGWQSRIVLEAERLVVYPAFKRAPRIVNYDQICDVGYGSQKLTGLTGASIHYYPLDYGGQLDVTRLCRLGLPFTSQNEGLRLVVQARMAGPPIDRTLELALLSKWMIKRFALFPILFGIVLLAIALQPESRARMLLVPLGLLEVGLLLTAIVMVWPVRRK